VRRVGRLPRDGRDERSSADALSAEFSAGLRRLAAGIRR
jgi:hypothetical protein